MSTSLGPGLPDVVATGRVRLRGATRHAASPNGEVGGSAPGFKDLIPTKNVHYLVNNFYIGYIGNDNILDILGEVKLKLISSVSFCISKGAVERCPSHRWLALVCAGSAGLGDGPQPRGLTSRRGSLSLARFFFSVF